jgi:hypothetical protein
MRLLTRVVFKVTVLSFLGRPLVELSSSAELVNECFSLWAVRRKLRYNPCELLL